MRSEEEMLQLILDTAREDERIRAVVMNGSRANPNAPHDRFQDFDVVYFVTDVEPYRHNLEWLKRFGELMILQLPDEMDDPPSENKESFAFLAQFTDGNRIDLGICPFSMIAEITADSQSIVLLDKDGRIPPLPPASDRDNLPRPPTAKQFADCCNEFWWVSPYVAKGLWRGEILYAREFLDQHVRGELMKMVRWYIGMRTGFTRSPGKYGKYVEKYLPAEEWERLLKTYSQASYEATWEALFQACDLFERLALQVAERFGCEYPHDDARRVRAHLEHVWRLPAGAEEMY
jgi:aminoglycoside 6-adenylyltransferase